MDRETEVDGVALEGLVVQHLCAWVQSQKENYQFAFWRTRDRIGSRFRHLWTSNPEQKLNFISME